MRSPDMAIISRHLALWLVVAGLIGLACQTLQADEQETRSARPNILWIIVDDFGWRDLGCYGSTLYESPNIDRLAREGVRFTQAYAAYPRCVPSRFAMMTGKYPARFQGLSDGLKITPGRDVTVGTSFSNAGYQTFYCGKWHLGDGDFAPGKNGFQTTIAAGAAGATASHFAPYNNKRNQQHKVEAPIEGLDDAPEGEYLTDRLTEETVKFIEHRAKDKPFFAVLAHYAVHTPLEAKPEKTARYRKKLAGQTLPEVVYEPESAGENLIVQNNPVYAAMIESVDEGVGKLLDCLDEQGLAENTIVVLTSDHGGLSARGNQRPLATSNRPLRAGKGHLYEGGVRIPLLVRWPGVTKAGEEVDSPVINTDFFPTLLEMAGIPLQPTDHRDGKSFAALLRGEAGRSDRPFYWHNPAPRPGSTGDVFSSALRVGNWKLLEFPESNRLELYDLQADLEEAHNLAEKDPQTTTRLFGQLQQWRNEVGAKMPGDKRPGRNRRKAQTAP